MRGPEPAGGVQLPAQPPCRANLAGPAAEPSPALRQVVTLKSRDDLTARQTGAGLRARWWAHRSPIREVVSLRDSQPADQLAPNQRSSEWPPLIDLRLTKNIIAEVFEFCAAVAAPLQKLGDFAQVWRIFRKPCENPPGFPTRGHWRPPETPKLQYNSAKVEDLLGILSQIGLGHKSARPTPSRHRSGGVTPTLGALRPGTCGRSYDQGRLASLMPSAALHGGRDVSAAMLP